jgi:16S rRNA (cytosine1402-N4)-methyltransferase
MSHVPVLLEEALAALMPSEPPARVIDGTLGAGGHTRALLERGAGHVLAFDLDPQAIAIARQTTAPFADQLTIVQGSYEHMSEHAQRLGWESVDAILLDLGVSSMQLDTPERGFAFRHEAPLDMRFAADGRLSAADIVNSWDERALAEAFFRYGEESLSRQYARAIVQQRPIYTTTQLAALIEQAAPRPRGKSPAKPIHPATRVFQALRIAVNDELRVIERTLPTAIDLLRAGGRLAVISFHSLEDRIVKDVFREAATEIVSPPGMASIRPKRAVVDLITPKPIEASAEEIARNPRARSAKLRVVQKRRM